MADTMFTRANPSPRYRELVELYRTMHTEGEKFLNVGPEKTFPGHSLPPEAHHIKALIDRSGARSILDYGSGKGLQYDARNVKLATGEVVESILGYWGVDEVRCYDPSFARHAELPRGRFDGVICTDVLEHCPEDDLPWIVTEIFSHAQRFVYANVACYPAMKRLPTGENAHCTLRAPEWWHELFRGVAAKFPGVLWELSAHVLVGDGSGRSTERRFRPGGEVTTSGSAPWRPGPDTVQSNGAAYTRANPSSRYRALAELYRTMHLEGEKFLGKSAEDTFPGTSLRPHVHHIRRLVRRTGASNILDFGSGKGQQYDARNVRIATGEVVESIVDYWGVDYVHCYDPSFAKYSTLPQGRFDGVISSNVLEHCPEEDLQWILTEMFAYADCFVYVNVACYPAVNRLPNGENAHCTIRAPEWWLDFFKSVAGSFPSIIWELSAHLKETDGANPYLLEQRFLSDEV